MHAGRPVHVFSFIQISLLLSPSLPQLYTSVGRCVKFVFVCICVRVQVLLFLWASQ